MPERLSKAQRSKIMGRVRSINTTPEIAVRRALHSAGFRFRLHRKDLPGTPDVVLRKHRLCLFINGCFWHRHRGCSRATFPATNEEFWTTKFKRTQERDKVALQELDQLGWRTLIIWECETKNPVAIIRVVKRFLGFRKQYPSRTGRRMPKTRRVSD
jgi:DNA mismatch endonuclease (patch repair protein)